MVLGLLMTRIMKKINLPNVTGYLIAGLIAGPYCLKIFSAGELDNMTVVTNAALGFIAFSIGGEFKLSALKQLGAKIFVIAGPVILYGVSTSVIIGIIYYFFK